MKEKELILNMVKEGTISIDDATKLLEFIDNPSMIYKFKKSFKNFCKSQKTNEFIKNVPSKINKFKNHTKSMLKSKKITENFEGDIIDMENIENSTENSKIYHSIDLNN